MNPNRPEAAIVIGGGVGPMAGATLHAKIIEVTRADAGDLSHLSVIHISRSSMIPDRSRYLLAKPGDSRPPNPGPIMADIFAAAARALNPGERAVGGVPCNTFHAPEIFNAFLDALRERACPVEIIHMHAVTGKLLKMRLGNRSGGNVGVLSTTGTRRTRLFDNLLEPLGFRVLHIPEADQDAIHEAIYHPAWGLKSASPPTDKAVEVVKAKADSLLERGAQAIILGCTELPLALPDRDYRGMPLVDPMDALARALVKAAAPDKLKAPLKE